MALWVLHAAAGVAVAVAVHVLSNAKYVCAVSFYATLAPRVQRPLAPPGGFVLRWRWDTEQNPQIWTHCADVTIV